MTRFILKPLKPRNPLVVACRQRRAGAHRRMAGGIRQRANRSLQHELQDLQDLQRQRHSP